MSKGTSAGRGALARVIATRGGHAAAEAPFVIEHREALIYMLCEAAELEHAIMCQYLYAAFSLKQSTDEGLTEAELEVVDRWRKTVSHIATQEMLHLTLVQNLLSSVGAAPHLSRPNLPQPAGHYPPGVVLTLLPFGEAALRHFMFLERPEGMDVADAPGLAAVDRAAPIMQEGDIVPRLQDFATVGHLYRSIEEGIRHLCAKYGARWLFVGPPEAQAGESDFGWPQLVQVTDVASAQRAIDTILEQGEGPRGHWRRAHFGSFVEILDEYQQRKAANPAFEPARPVLPATVRPSEGDTTTPLIADPFTARCTDLFNVSYEILLQALARYFAHTDEDGTQLGVLADLTVGLMFNVIKPLGQLITTLPVDAPATDRTAGPSFELFYESDYLLPHRDAAWALIEERLREAAAFAERLANDGAPEVTARLAPIGSALLGHAHALATCRAEWGGRSHAGEVTVAHRRRDALAARSRPEVTVAVDSLASALREALQAEQSLALGALRAAASLGQTATGGTSEDDQDTVVRSQKRGLAAEADRRFAHVVDLADLLVAVVGGTEIEPPPAGERSRTDASPADLVEMYAEIGRRLLAIDPEALLVDPRPAPTFAAEERRHPLPGIVDRASALALIEQISQDPTPPGVPSPEEMADQLRTAGPTNDARPPAAAHAAARGSIDASAERGQPAEDRADQLGRLFTNAYAAFLRVLGHTVGDEQDVVVARHRLREVAARLRASVLRPLADEIHRPGAEPPNGPTPQHRTAATVEEQLRALALAATDLRVNLAMAPPGLLEAAAALQDLALTYSVTGEGEQAELLRRFRDAERDLPPSIQPAPNGPYLLTNVDRLTNGLGDPIPARPQMALCRCGQSAAKPWCDGSHARVDFVDAKDPHRVADRRDTYEGVAITVFDNRGICQHSGYCTDRIATAFRTDQEPFVAPGGARVDEIIRAVRDCPSGALSFAIDGHEQRDQVDWHHRRSPAVVVTTDGPYRVTGAIPLLDRAGDPVGRNEGSSLEHYALCRCGHSQNKPFCSGMHWYIEFRDPIPDPSVRPTLYEWCGGMPALNRMTRLFFERHVPDDPLLAPRFANAPPDRPERFSEWLAHVMGGPPCPPDEHGPLTDLLAAGGDRAYTEEERSRFVSLLSRSAGEAGLPTDPEFGSALAALIDWVSRQAVRDADEDKAGLRWDWGPAGPPARPEAPAAAADIASTPFPGPGEPVSFGTHIQPLFRPRDRQAMSFAFDLWSYDAVKEQAQAIVDRLRAGTMPCDGAWPKEKTDLFQRWMDDRTPP